MQLITKTLSDIVCAAFERCGYDAALGVVTASDRVDLCQFQCNGAMKAAKLYKKAPIAIANEVAEILRENDIFAKADAVPPGFLNLTLMDSALLDAVNAAALDGSFGIPQAKAGETIVIDYGGANVAKALHIGHLRPAIIGEALKRLAKSVGATVLGDVHLGDWGLQIGLVIAELEARNPQWDCFQPDFPAGSSVPALSVPLLNEVYPAASAKSKIDKKFSAKAHAATVALQNREAGCIALWQEMMRVSVPDLRKIYDRLNADFDLWYGESDADVYIAPTLDTVREKGLLKESDGAWIVEVVEETDKAPMPPILLRKSDGSSNYETTDLATIYQRQKDFQPARIWYVTDNRQALHFEQVFRCAKKAALVPPETELAHLPHGTMNGSDGKPYKTRDGGVMRLEDFLNTVVAAAYEKLNESDYVTQGNKQEVAEKLGIAAIKFGDLVNHRTKDYVFDMDRFLAFEGKTGVYILYTITRINSILKKAGFTADAAAVPAVYSDLERTILLSVLLTGEIFLRAFDEKALNYLAENAFNLAALFSRFYHDNHILTETDEAKKQSWLTLCALVKRMLEMHMDVLGMETVENM